MKSSNGIIVSILIISYFVSIGFALQGEGPEPNLPDYVSDEIIVKFAESTGNAVEMQLQMKLSADQLSISQGIDQLNAKYGVKEVKPVFKGFKNAQQKFQAMQAKSASLLNKKQKHILQRQKRAPANARAVDLSRIYKIKAKIKAGQSLEEMVAEYSKSSDVEYAELNYIGSVDAEPNDRYYPIQWALNNTGQWYQESGKYNHQPGKANCDIDAPQAWDICSCGNEVIVAVVDTGVDYRHRDLVNKMWSDENGYHGYDYVNDDNYPMDDYGHGTHCAGIIAAEKDNNFDIAGVCSSAKIMALKWLNENGNGNMADAAAAIYYAVDNGADIISCSWGDDEYVQAVKDAVDYAYSQGVVVVASAGNSNSNVPQYPADYNHVISVAATDSNDNKALFSNYGSWVDIAAPGVDIFSLRCELYALGMIYDNYTTILSGTSMACPYVAGGAAMLLSIDPAITVDQLETHLENSTDAIDANICVSGRLNLYNALMSTVNSYGRIILDKDFYSCSGEIKVQLFDSDLAGNSTQGITVSTSTGDSETVILEELSSAAGVFVGSITIDSQTIAGGDGLLQVSDGDVITATYDTATDTAEVDCQPPMVSNLQIDASGPIVKVTFDTNEATRAKIRAGLDCDQHSITTTDPVIRTSHEIELRFLEPDKAYYFVIDVTDSAGNVTTDSNSSNCYSFTTVEPLRVPGVYSTIQAAIDTAVEGDTVVVADGTYTGSGNRDIEFKGKSITVKSENGPQNCIIDCEGTPDHRGFLFESRECWRAVLNGLTVTNGRHKGGGLRCDDSSSPTITNCWIIDNSTSPNYSLGGGILLDDTGSSPTITNCVISNNTATFQGGGIYTSWYNSPIISNCKINNNWSGSGNGGGIMIQQNGSLILYNCIIKENYSDAHGGGICVAYKNGYCGIINSIIINNSALGYGGGLLCSSSNPILTNCILWDNIAANGLQAYIQGSPTVPDRSAHMKISYSNIQYGQTEIVIGDNATLDYGPGNIETDPCFVNTDTNDFHLRCSSPCINAGDPNYFATYAAVDIDEDIPILYGRVDIGADEFKSIEGDFEPDGNVDSTDLQVLTNSWLDDCNWPYWCNSIDIDQSGKVDMADFAILAENWLKE